MNRTEAKDYINSQAASYFRPDRKGKGFICPICGSGSGKNGTGLTTKDGKHFSCWRGCFTHKDLIDIIGLQYGLTEFKDQLEKAAELLNITLDSDSRSSKSSTKSKSKKAAAENQKQDKIEPPKQPTGSFRENPPKLQSSQEEQKPVDYTDFFNQAAKNLNKTTYHRGISEPTLQRFNVGYIEAWNHPKTPQAPLSPRLIIPTSKQSYLARDTREELTDEQRQYSKQKVGLTHIFNLDALKQSTLPVFITEGEIDALSIMDVGGEAVGLGSVGQVNNLLKRLTLQKPAKPLLIAMDNDEAGKKAAIELTTGLTRQQVPFEIVEIYGQNKDANAALNADRDGFRAAVEYAIEAAEAAAIEAREAAREELKKEAVAYSLDDFVKNIQARKTATFYPTGFSELDSVLDGGLYAGLYIVGAISSLGKTTFCLQLADQVAKQGTDVLIFSMEMAREELIAKSLSRLTYIMAKERTGETSTAKTTRGILTGSRYENYNQEELDLIEDAVAAYKDYGANLYITEGIGEVTTEIIKEKVERHITITGKAPVVVIDYLQIIAPFDPRATDKQNTDKAVLELKRLSRDYSIPVIGISSFNRENYLAPVNLASFKESGAIEYSSDVLIGLQYDGMDYKEGESVGDRQERIRELRRMVEEGGKGSSIPIQVKVLKHRNGSRGQAVLDYYPMFNCFKAREDSGQDLLIKGYRRVSSR